jgi:CdiI immunity protein
MRALPNLDYLLRAYFNQDWELEGDTTQAVLDGFMRENSAMCLVDVLRDAEALEREELSEHHLQEQLERAGLAYAPGFDGLMDRSWLRMVVTRLQSAAAWSGGHEGRPRDASPRLLRREGRERMADHSAAA